jgi:hypothetical protein
MLETFMWFITSSLRTTKRITIRASFRSGIFRFSKRGQWKRQEILLSLFCFLPEILL